MTSLLSEQEENLLMTASILANQIKTKIEISDPTKRAPMGRDCNDTTILPEPGANIKPKVEPNPGVIIEKKAHRKLKVNLSYNVYEKFIPTMNLICALPKI